MSEHLEVAGLLGDRLSMLANFESGRWASIRLSSANTDQVTFGVRHRVAREAEAGSLCLIVVHTESETRLFVALVQSVSLVSAGESNIAMVGIEAVAPHTLESLVEALPQQRDGLRLRAAHDTASPIIRLEDTLARAVIAALLDLDENRSAVRRLAALLAQPPIGDDGLLDTQRRADELREGQTHSKLIAMLLILQSEARALEAWIGEQVPMLIIIAFTAGLFSILAIPTLHRGIRLMHRGSTTPIVVADGYSHLLGGAGPGGILVDQKARPVGSTNEFPADRLYNKGDHAYLTYSARFHYGVITAAPPRSFADVLRADGEATYVASYPIGVIVTLILTNGLAILVTVVEHTIGTYVTDHVRSAPGRLKRASIVARSALEGLLAGTLSMLPLAATVAAFSASIKIENDSVWALYSIYGLLVIFFASHVSALAASSLLAFFRSSFGTGLKEIIAYGISLAAAVHVIVKFVHLTFSDRILDVSSWAEVAREFIQSLFE